MVRFWSRKRDRPLSITAYNLKSSLLKRVLAFYSLLFLVKHAVALPAPGRGGQYPGFGRHGRGAHGHAPIVLLPTQATVTTCFTESVPETQTASTSAQPFTDVTTTPEVTVGLLTQSPFPEVSASLPTVPVAPTVSISVQPTAILGNAGSTLNIFDAPVATGAPPAQFAVRSDHPVAPIGIASNNVQKRQSSPSNGPLQTNKFYTSWLIANQDQTVWVQPYSMQWAKGQAGSWGMSVANIDRENLVFGPPPQDGEPAKYFFAPTNTEPVVLSASELGSSTVMTTDSHEPFSIVVNLAASPGSANLISFPVVQGMGFVSAIYKNAGVVIYSATLFTDLVQAGTVNSGATYKWQVTLKDGSNWLLYVTPSGADGRPPFTLQNSNNVIGPSGFTGLVQIAKNNAGSCGEEVYDTSAGAYAVSASIDASVDGSAGTYELAWARGGSTSQKLLMFALPHHMSSLSAATKAAQTCVTLWTTTKGLATAVTGDSMVLQETDLPVNISFEPWTPEAGSINKVSDDATQKIIAAATAELAQDLDAQTNLDSMYYAGKALSKYAMMVYAVNKFGNNPSLAAQGLQKLENAFARWINNTPIWPLVYDSRWGGVASSASYDGRPDGADFGNTYYNDHHFHYGYFIHTAAVIGYLHPQWLDQGSNKAWVNTLIRDFANSDIDDQYFPFSRNFDWYQGHSWATGLYALGDGKNEESTSEDTFASYAMKMWGSVIGDANMVARGNLQLAIMRNSLNKYFYYDDSNTVQPPQFTPNMASGILFENKIDHTTYFGDIPEFIQGIHMLPISPITTYIRPNKFVSQEWTAYFASTLPLYATPDPNTGIIPQNGFNCNAQKNRGRTINCVTTPGWKGILLGNLAQVNPSLAWNFFADEGGVNGPGGWDNMWLDGGASRTWYLTWSAAMGGSL